MQAYTDNDLRPTSDPLSAPSASNVAKLVNPTRYMRMSAISSSLNRRSFLVSAAAVGASSIALAIYAQGDSDMPLVRIDLSKNASKERIRAVSDAVYGAMVEIANVPLHDKFQIITRHADDEIIYPEEGYLGIEYSRDLIIIQITWVGGRATDVKKKFYKRIADEIHEKEKVRKEDIWISLVDSAREDWSFGNGEMQYAPK
jgi:phenylpyruvate tautomerase PptA (4-oxalocrotonate tautomerase family)